MSLSTTSDIHPSPNMGLNLNAGFSTTSGTHRRLHQAGFSLIELMIAMTVTLIISGTMYAFITQTGNAFSREPGLADRQQQIRLAMDRIQQDVLMAGLNLGRNFQVFTPGLNGLGPLVGVTAAQNTDALELRTLVTNCPQVRLCPKDTSGYASSLNCTAGPSNPYVGIVFKYVNAVPACYPEPGYQAVLYGDGNAKYGWGRTTSGVYGLDSTPPAGATIDNGVTDVECSVAAGATGGACPAANLCTLANAAACPYAIAPMDQIRYQIVNDPTDGSAALYRSATGGFAGTGVPVQAGPPGATWQLVARGVEDMQIRYRTRRPADSATDFWATEPPVMGTDPDFIVREVEITLWSRTSPDLRNLAGQTTAANGVNAVRGSMTMRVAPRPALDYLVGAATNRWQ